MKILNKNFTKLILSFVDKFYYKSYLHRDDVKEINQNSLLFYYGNIHSQRGQDMILSEIFRRLNMKKGLFVEFGAWDGMYLCNSRWLYEKGWSGVFIEANIKRYKKLCKIYENDLDIKKINDRVGAPKNGVQGVILNDLLELNGINVNDVSFVSIDVDGPDLEIFTEIGFRPPVVLLEGGFNFSPYFESSIPKEISWKNMQQPLHYIFSVAEEMGYKPVCFYQDTYLVRSDLSQPFVDCAYDAVAMYKDAFMFMPNDYRESLLNYRENSDEIKKLETNYFGFFKKNPLEY